MSKSVFGLGETGAAMLSYVLGPITGVAVLVMERKNKFVRFHALQSTIWFLMFWIVGFVINFGTALPIIGGLFGLLFAPVVFLGGVVYVISKLVLIIKAFLGETFKLPIIGEVVWNQVNK